MAGCVPTANVTAGEEGGAEKRKTAQAGRLEPLRVSKRTRKELELGAATGDNAQGNTGRTHQEQRTRFRNDITAAGAGRATRKSGEGCREVEGAIAEELVNRKALRSTDSEGGDVERVAVGAVGGGTVHQGRVAGS